MVSQGLEIFNLYELFVNYAAGGIALSGILLAGIMTLIAFMAGMSPLMVIFLVGSFVMVFSIGYLGAVAAFPLFILANLYFWYSFIKWFQHMGSSSG